MKSQTKGGEGDFTTGTSIPFSDDVRMDPGVYTNVRYSNHKSREISFYARVERGPGRPRDVGGVALACG